MKEDEAESILKDRIKGLLIRALRERTKDLPSSADLAACTGVSRPRKGEPLKEIREEKASAHQDLPGSCPLTQQAFSPLSSQFPRNWAPSWSHFTDAEAKAKRG